MPDAATLSHMLLWLIGAMSLGTLIATCAAMFAMGRSGYRKD